ncbi:nuclear transport factor 2 family protein [Ferruginibacter sp. SUN106]|uniref:nuclear transport factor 2 family protein n=1 Tax=Ferruginibacter sp. SUN106 TaxID=2978348 RepID=UPI003D3601E3
MKFYFVILSLLFFISAVAQTADEKKLIETVKEFHQALIQKNTIALNQQTDKALSYGHSNGWVQSKKDLIKDFETGYISYQGFKEDSITVAINENMANVRFVADVTATMKETTSNFHLKVLEVWVKKGKRWVLFARQAIRG